MCKNDEDLKKYKKSLNDRTNKKQMNYNKFIEHLTKECPRFHKICPNVCNL